MIEPFNSTLTKGIASYHGFAPKSISRGKGALLFDGEGREYLDCGMALGSVSLGYAYDAVDSSVIDQILKGVNFSRPSLLEEDLTSFLRKDLKAPDLIVRYAKSSSMLLSVVPRIARFFTSKKFVAYPKNCFLGNTDWYLSHNNCGGILSEIKDTTLTFMNGDVSSLQSLFDNFADKLACIIMEPYREAQYSPEFYNLLKELCSYHNVLLVFDETVTGYRFYHPLAQQKIKCIPDLTILGKAFANGYALACIMGSEEIFDRIEKASLYSNLFDFSTTHAGESVGLAAALETLKIYSTENVAKRIGEKGSFLLQSMEKAINENGLEAILVIKGHPAYFKIQNAKPHPRVENLIKELLFYFFQNGILCRGLFAMSLSHSSLEVERIAEVFSEFCQNYSVLDGRNGFS